MYLSLDVGGTNTRIASSYDLKNIVKDLKFDTSQDLETQKSLIEQGIAEICAGEEELKGICLGVPGLVNKKENKFEKIVNVPALSNIYAEELLPEHIRTKNILAENDATLAGLGEAVLGIGKDYEVVVYLTLSTGVGGVRIAGKQIDPYQKFSEPGHMIIEEDGRYFELCGQKGCLSAYVSGTAFKSVYGVSPIDCEDSEIWGDYAKKLSLGIINILALWAPDVIVLGGSMSKKFEECFKKPLLLELEKDPLFEIPPIVKNNLGDKSGIYGGFVLMSQKFN